MWRKKNTSGLTAENTVAASLKAADPDNRYVISDIMLPSPGNTKYTQIDHIVVSRYGIFCIETKGHNGSIYGNATQRYWRQYFRGSNKSFEIYNPLHQNHIHVKAIKQSLGYPLLKKPITSLVVFPNAQKIAVSNTAQVGNLQYVLNYISLFSQEVYTPSEGKMILTKLLDANVNNRRIRKHHVREVRHLVAAS